VWLELVEEVSLDLSVSLETTDRDQVTSHSLYSMRKYANNY
jgi:hypothetical protein